MPGPQKAVMLLLLVLAACLHQAAPGWYTIVSVKRLHAAGSLHALVFAESSRSELSSEVFPQHAELRLLAVSQCLRRHWKPNQFAAAELCGLPATMMPSLLFLASPLLRAREPPRVYAAEEAILEQLLRSLREQALTPCWLPVQQQASG